MAFKAVLEFDGNEYEVLFSKVDLIRRNDGKDAVSSGITEGRLHLKLKSTANTFVLEQAIKSEHKSLSGKVTFFNAESEKVVKVISFEKAFIVFFSEQLFALGETTMTTEITFSAEKITLDNNWAKA
ncbi:hypothetical protein BC749_10459 [Flavobacterium araucananum]|uniref:Type VI secretion system needle protein Hcp n=1 Tax=Flavobacterium araucananum TaxID=946678 RepID=A0A227NFJ6_9FLAO|nr:type VI secretion system tube protein TssD [Flavobacterium araucananum]OXE96500.1 type VI secretion system needle protein Hcp [Flavobacterium araucananum]PWJ98915.1 hypothetical protein BC749_10459 [Flavobacterium araucananum]